MYHCLSRWLHVQKGRVNDQQFPIVSLIQLTFPKSQWRSFWAHVDTKMELSSYLVRKTIEQGQSRGKRVIAWSNQCQASRQEMSHLSSDQEEADTKLILHALDATNAGATNLQIHSPDTDVLVRALRRYPQLCENTVFVTGAAQRRRNDTPKANLRCPWRRTSSGFTRILCDVWSG